MKKKLSIFITIIVLNLTCATNYTILKALVFAKHGEQSPVIFLKNDEKIWPFGPNKITINGKKSAHTFGEFLKIRYIEQYNLIEKYRTSETLFQSTESESSIMSSIIALAKLFEPKSVEQHHWDKDIDYVPVPIHMILKSRDFILFPESCKYIIDANKKIMEQVKFKEILKENKGFIDKINDLKLLKGKMNFTDLHNLAQNLIVKKSNDIPLPEWANNKMGDETYEIKLFNINQKLKKVFYNNKNYYTTAASFPISTVLDDFQGVLDGTEVTKFELYVATKTNIISQLLMFKSFNNMFPGPMASLIYELVVVKGDSLENGEKFVRMYYRDTNGSNNTLIELSLDIDGQKCSHICPYNSFVSILSKYRMSMEVIEDICEIETYPQFYKYLSFFLIFLIVLVFTGIVAVGIKSYANRIDEIPIEYEEVITSTNNDEVDSLDIKTNIN